VAEAQQESSTVVVAALAANIGIAVAKFVAAALSGSSSMLTEGVHSVVDSLNQVLLLYGQHRAKRPPDQFHPFGYARELYFWAFVVAILIFSVGAGVSVYEGYLHIVDPEPLGNATLNYVVLGVSALLEGSSWALAMRAFFRSKGDTGVWQAVQDSKDPSTFIVLFEDSAALAGLVVAVIGVFASHALGDPRIDGMASIVIGLMLAAVAVLLSREAKGLLIGERADPAVIAHIRDIVAASPAITAVNHVRTIHTGPQAIFAAISADFVDNVTMGDAERLIEDLEARLKRAEPSLISIYIRPERQQDATRIALSPEQPAIGARP
jgi:cation diffusion facilitator family transporter